jgi:Helix-turn-helix of DDE superfamily endonuclease
MKYEKISGLGNDRFRRLTGVKRETFNRMVEILRIADRETKSRGGRKNTCSLEDRLLMTLEYLREYRTYFHVSQSYGVSESTAYKTVKWVEETLIKHPDFSLPGRKALSKSDSEYELILIDATETPIERPKKNKSGTIQVRKKGTPSKVRLS